MRTVRLTGGKLLDQVYREILVPSFHPDELQSLTSLRAGVRSGGTLASAVVDDAGRALAGLVGEWSPSCRVMLLSYLAVTAAARGGGIGGPFYDEVIGAWRETYRPCLIVAEVEHPDRHESSEAYGDPAARLRFYGRHGARVLNLPYFQPALGPGRSRVYGILLLALHVDPALSGPGGPDTVAAAPLREFLVDYLEVEGGVADDPPTRAMLDAVEAGGGVALLPADRYTAVPVAIG